MSYSSDNRTEVKYTLPLGGGSSSHNTQAIFTPVSPMKMVQENDAWLTKRVNARVDETSLPTRLVKVDLTNLPAGIKPDALGNLVINNNGNILSVRYSSRPNELLTSHEAGMTSEGFKIYTGNVKKEKDIIIVTTDTTEFNIYIDV